MEHTPESKAVESGNATTGKSWRGILCVVTALGLVVAVWGFFEAVRIYRPRGGEWIEPRPIPEWKDDFSNIMPTMR